MRSLIALVVLLSIPAPAFEVHEWGTFTTLSGSDGRPLTWYLPHGEPSALPPFVRKQGTFLKSSPASVRMETPVIYFYPRESHAVTVEATYLGGGITEVYPSAHRPLLYGPVPVQWKGILLPPGDREANALIPEVREGSAGDHYAAARAVPDAWIFRSTPPQTGAESEKALADEAEKFIFYRGSGQTSPQITASIDASNRITLTNGGMHPHRLNVALEVEGEKARWARLTPVLDSNQSAPAKALTGEMLPISRIEPEITAWFLESLAKEGLTPEEAAAMVDTWDETWFREEGLRVFSILPAAWIDEVLPLNINPKPEKLVRVFVARQELIAPARENRLADLLIAGSTTRSQIESLNLGRFSDGALSRAVQIQSSRMQQRFHQLRFESPNQTSAR